ncbi:MAG TPA: hypothetical protein VFQ92_05550, partial [Blastocatellia bacterium]|nr:hypothetical protein [Blastocatellia bacterium]
MGALSDMKMYARFAWGLRDFLRNPITPDQARASIELRLAEREESFLRLVERGIFKYRRSPYLPLMRLAGCEMGDIRNLVRARGLEQTLDALRDAGVYIGFEEFKGREPIVRNGQTIPVDAHSFDNPYLSNYYRSETGGTTGAGTRVETDLDHLAAQSAHTLLTREAHGVLDVPTALWRGVLPDGSGINNLLRAAHFGSYPDKWFSPVISRGLKEPLKYRLATWGTVAIGRLVGTPLPWPELVSMEDAIVVARWAAETLKSHSACLVLS